MIFLVDFIETTVTDPVSMDQALIRKLTDIVITNISNLHFGVEDLAREAGISRITLYRKIKLIKKQDTGQFIREIRLRRAMELLQQNVGTVSEVAFMVGFGDPSYFNKCFHDFFGFPPGKVKKETAIDAKETIILHEIDIVEPKLPFRRAIIIPLSVILALAALYIGYTFIYKPSNTRSNSEITKEKSIAILPFKNLSDSLGNQYFVDGITEDLHSKLGKIHDLTVISRTSTEQFRNNNASAFEIGQRLHVNYFVEGSGQKYGSTFELRVRLIEVAIDRQIWSHAYKKKIRTTRDIFNIQNHIAQAIASALKASITPKEKKLIEKIPTTNLTAFDFYQRGRMSHTNYWISGNKAELDMAEDLYHKSLEYDSAFAPGYTGLAKIYWDKHFFQDYMSENFMDSVLMLCDKALLLNDQLADVHTLLGRYYGQKGDLNNASKEIEKALELDPNDWEAYRVKGETDVDPVNTIKFQLKAISLNRGPELPSLLQEIGWLYATYGFPEKALQCYEDKLKLDGNLPEYYSSAARDEFWLGNINKSFELEKKGYEIDSTNTLILEFIALDYQWLGQFSESLKYFKKWFERLNSTGILAISYTYKDNYLFNMMHRIGYVYWKNGYKEKAEHFFDAEKDYCNNTIKHGRDYGRTYNAYYDLACIYAFRGDKNKALENLREYDKVRATYQWMVMLFKTDPLLEGIRNDPEFQNIAKNIESKYQAEHERVRKWLEEQGML